MDSHIKKYFRMAQDGASGHSFHHVIALHEAPDISWREISKKVPALPKGWFELAELNSQDRIDLLRDFWITKLPFCPHLMDKVDDFFSKLDDVGIFLVQPKFQDPYHAELVYSLKGDIGFFRGQVPATEDELSDLQKLFQEAILPEDYMAFLRIHNGFSKADDTGIIPTSKMPIIFSHFQDMVSDGYPITTDKGEQVNPKSLIPFYESFGMPFFQCFWTEWYPENEMGNVYFAGNERSISKTTGLDPNSESMAFYTFLSWLFFYIEAIA